MTHILINGEKKETISIFDRGLQYGDGLFETMAVRHRKIPLWDSHWERLTRGCEQLSISTPNKEILEKEIDILCNDKDENQFIIKLIVTRGVGERGYRFSGAQNVTRILSSHPLPDYPMSYQSDGVAVRYCDTTLSANKKLAGIKHLNRLEQVLARNEWDTDEYQEGLMLSAQGLVIDGTMSNIFAVKDNMVFTPDLSICGVSGVMRKTVIKLSKNLGFPVYEKTFTKSELEDADELFLTNSIFGIWPIIKIAKTQFTKIGVVTKQLQEELKKIR
jgi:4-amino-4-deoxychorismate lyase